MISVLERHANSTQENKLLGWGNEYLWLAKYVTQMEILMLFFSGVGAVGMSYFWVVRVDIDFGRYLVPLCHRLALSCLMFLAPVREPPNQ